MLGTTNLFQVADASSTGPLWSKRFTRQLHWPPNLSLRAGFALGVRGYLAAYHRLEIIGRDRLPTGGPFVMVSNHASHLDAVCLRAALPLPRLDSSFTAVAEDYFFANPFRRAAAKVLANAVPFSRYVRIRGGLRHCRDLLGGVRATLIYFPEGTRSRDGQMGAFRPGIGALLAGSDLQVVPCAVHGSFDAWPKGCRLARPGRIRVVIGQARRYGSLPHGHQSHHFIAADLRSAVEALLCK
jgi:1-acyl-sn-glycerol-3-phosphate acyltransferase